FDNYGNVYVSGGTPPFKTSKYSNTGALIWTFTFSITWSVFWYSKFCVLQNSGSLFFGEGYNSAAAGTRILKINNAGNCIITSPYFGNNNEIWLMFYNYCIKKLFAFGGGTITNNDNLKIISDTNLTSSTSKSFNGAICGLGSCNDIASAVMDDNGDFYAISTSLSGCTSVEGHLQKSLASNNYNPPSAFDVNTGYKFQEPLCKIIVQGGTVRANALALNSNYLFSYDGKILMAWNKTNGNLLSSLIVNATYTDGSSRTHEGIDVDECNNVYVGGQNQVHVYKFDGTTFNPKPSITTNIPGEVYDIKLDRTKGILIVCGNAFLTTVTANIKVCDYLKLDSTVDATCAGGTICEHASGGTPPYTFAWSTGAVATSDSVSCITVPNGTYYVTVTDNSCSRKMQIDTIIVKGAGTMSLTATGGAICSGTTTTITVSGASFYTWSNNSNSSTQTVSPITTTTYFVTGSDGLNCTGTASCVVTVYNNLILTTTGSTICKGNIATISASGGTSYTWNTGGTSSSISINPTSTTTYSISGTDANGCTNTAQAIVTVKPLPNVTATGGTICNGDNINITANNAITYTWNTGSNNNPYNVNPNTTTTYTVTGTDNNTCTNTAQAVVTVKPLPNVTATGGTICNGNNINITANNATTYTWNSGSNNNPYNVNPNTTTTYSVTGTDANGCTNTAQAIVTVNPLPNVTATGGTICNGDNINITANNAITYTWNTGSNNNPYNVNPNITTTYTVTGTDNNNCVNTAQAIVKVNPLPNVTATGNPLCVGDKSTLTAAGANTYSWDNGLGSGNPKVVKPTVSTVYIVTGTDVNGCIGTAKVVICVSINSPVSVNNPTICYGTSATLNASGVLTYTWNNLQTGNTITVNPIATTTYNVTGTDVNGCSNTAKSVVTVSPQMFVNIINQKDATCGFANGSATITASGGMPYTTGILNYNCIWSTGETTPTINNLKAGTYIVTVTDSIGCSAITTVTIKDTPPVTLSIYSNPASCFPNGTATVTIVTGTAPFTYIWSSGQTTQTANVTNTITNINSGIYTVTVIDSMGCSAIKQIEVENDNPLTHTISPTPEHCGKIDGTATTNVLGGNSALYTYLWNNGETTKTINNLSQGNYIVTVNYGTCKITGTTIIGETYGPNADYTYTPAILDLFENTTALFEDLSTTGGQPIVKWHWDFYDDNSTSDIQLPAHTYKNTGTYTVCLKVTDSENCVDSICKPIIVKDIFTVYIPNAFSPNSDMLNEGFIPQGYNIDPNGFQMTIFDRWGGIIYKTTDINIPWNGRYMNNGDVVQIGVYVYRVIVKEKEGPEHELIGRVSVVR
ncbi:MAG: gliding motility-associated C-terminal domain-containing protein, partial [Bacteroidales bacterium]|nr:gliding motility-associated C-terminal domain-containing protein [Bacteroidales bacterium]